MQSKTSNRFLLIRWSGMGDVVMTLPAVRWLRNRFDSCHITYLTDAAFAKIIEHSGYVDTIETIDRRGFIRSRSFLPSLFSLFGIIWRLRRTRFDFAFDLQGFGETALLAYLSGAPVRIGRYKESFLRKRIYTLPIDADWGRDHRSLFFLRAVTGPFGINPSTATERPILSKTVSEKKDALSPRIGLNIGASTESRRWSEQNFFQLARRLTQRGYTVRFFLGPQETAMIETVKEICMNTRWEVSVQSQIEPLMQALSECAVLVSNDTGPGHLAAALDVPVVTLYSTGSPENVGPMAVGVRWFRNEADINDIRVDDVELACVELLEDKNPQIIPD